MAMTTSIHGGSKLSLAHNRRLILGEPHVDYTKSHTNVVLERHDRHQFYKQIFGEAIEEYNKKQVRKDREIDVYDSKGNISGEKIVGWVRRSKGKEREFLVAFGHSNDLYDDDVKKKLLLEYYEDFVERNPNLRVMDAVIHMDEAQPHMHIVVVPVAETARGVGLKVSMDAALAEQQGITFDRSMKKKKGNPFFLKFRDQELEVAKRVLKKNNIPFAEGDKRKVHLSTSEYKKIMSTLSMLEAKNEELTEVVDGLKTEIKIADRELNFKKRTIEKLTYEVSDLELERSLFTESRESVIQFSELMRRMQRHYGEIVVEAAEDLLMTFRRLWEDSVSPLDIVKTLGNKALNWVQEHVRRSNVRGWDEDEIER